MVCATVGVLVMAAVVMPGVLAQTRRDGQTGGPTAPRLALESLTGRDSFELYCASCHGRDGAGRGPVAASLRTAPADLTTLSQRNGGTFPRPRVLAFVEGTSRQAGAHGTSDMPIWGTTFKALETSDARVRLRLVNLVAYVESLQRTGAATPGAGAARPSPVAGAQLFRESCANCHGPTGRGDGGMVPLLRRLPPDLTKYSARNGGVFPAERLRRIIDGRDVGAHGDPAMPV
jgi:mono/diheme cytochrome c family protein